MTLSLAQNIPLFNSPIANITFLCTLLISLMLSCLLATPDRSFTARFKDWVLFLAAMSVYESLKHLHLASLSFWLGIHPKDQLLLDLDVRLFGQTPLRYFADWGLSKGWWRELFKAFYLTFYVMPVLVMGYFQWKDDKAGFYLVRRAMLLGLYGGYVSYVLIPATGPLAAGIIAPPPPEKLYSHIRVVDVEQMVETLRYQFDCFPSLHTAVPWMLLLLAGPRLPLAGSVVLAACTFGITISTMALGLHYGVDVIAGIAWAFATCALAKLTLAERPFFAWPFKAK